MEQNASSSAYRKILVPFDGSPGSLKALRRALWLAKSDGSAVTALAVDEHLPRYAPGVGQVEEEDELRDAYLAGLREQAMGLGSGHGVAVQFEGAVGHAAQTIVQRAREQGFDLIAIGHSGHSGVWGTLLGSTTTRVADHAQCDVLVVR